MSEDELYVAAKELQAPYELVRRSPTAGKLPVVLFTAGGIATPADAAMMMQLGAEGVFVGSGIFKSGNPAQRAEAIVKATTFYDDPDVIAKVSRGLGEAMVGINVDEIPAAAPPRRARLVVRPHGGRPPVPAGTGGRSSRAATGQVTAASGAEPSARRAPWPSRTAARCCAAASASAWVTYSGAKPSRTRSGSRKSPTTPRAISAWTTA